jgi:hypothetical protein
MTSSMLKEKKSLRKLSFRYILKGVYAMNKSAQRMTKEDINALIDALVEYGIVKLIDEPKEQGEQV